MSKEIDLRRNNPNVVSNKYIPEPGEFTKDFRRTLKLGPKTRNRTARIILKGLEACERLDHYQATLSLQLANATMRRKEIAFEVNEKVKLQAELSATQLEFGAADKEIERLKAALAIATDYVANESTRTSMGQLYDIEQALKGGE